MGCSQCFISTHYVRAHKEEPPSVINIPRRNLESECQSTRSICTTFKLTSDVDIKKLSIREKGGGRKEMYKT